jgi:hypothetical protein
MPKSEHTFIRLKKTLPGFPAGFPFAGAKRLMSLSGLMGRVVEYLDGLYARRARRDVITSYLQGLMVTQHRNMLSEIYSIVDFAEPPLTREQLLDWLYKRACQITNDQDVQTPEEITAYEAAHPEMVTVQVSEVTPELLDKLNVHDPNEPKE